VYICICEPPVCTVFKNKKSLMFVNSMFKKSVCHQVLKGSLKSRDKCEIALSKELVVIISSRYTKEKTLIGM
jgi:hypothetical protein